MALSVRNLLLAFFIIFPISAPAEKVLNSASGEVRIIGSEFEPKSVAVAGRIFRLDDLHAELLEKVGNLILVGVYSGGNGCPASYVWLNTKPGQLGLSDSFGTCSEIYELTYNRDSVTIKMPSLNASEGIVAFNYDGKLVSRELIGLKSSRNSQSDPSSLDDLIGTSPYEYLTAQENEARLIQTIGWDALDELRNSIIIGSQEMTIEGNWITGEGCRPHRCNTDFAAIAIHRKTGELIAAIKREGVKARLFGKPRDSLPSALRSVMVAH